MKLTQVLKQKTITEVINEGVKMSPSTLKQVDDNENVVIGYEAEFFDEDLFGTWFEEYGGVDNISLDNARDHPEWYEEEFEEQAEEWKKGQYDQVEEFWDESFRAGDLMDEIRQAVFDDEKEHHAPIYVSDWLDLTFDEEAEEEFEDEEEWVQHHIDQNEESFYDYVVRQEEDEIYNRFSTDREEEIKDEIEDMFDEDEFWEEERYGILDAMSIEHGDDDNTISQEKLQELSDRMQADTGIMIIRTTNEYGPGFDDEDYVMSTDNDNAELISPPLDLKDGFGDLNKVLDWIDENAGHNEYSSMHVGVSLKNKDIRKADFLKLALFLGEDYVLEQSQREKSSWASKMVVHTVDKFVRMLEENKDRPDLKAYEDYLRNVDGRHNQEAIERAVKKRANQFKDIWTTESLLQLSAVINNDLEDELARMVRDDIMSGNRGSFDVGKIRRGYLEFRIIGDDYYAKHRRDEVFTTIRRFAYVMELAHDRDAFRKEYLKKLGKMATGIISTAMLDTEGDAFQRMMEIIGNPALNAGRETEVSTDKITTNVNKLWTKFAGSPNGDVFARWVRDAFYNVHFREIDAFIGNTILGRYGSFGDRKSKLYFTTYIFYAMFSPAEKSNWRLHKQIITHIFKKTGWSFRDIEKYIEQVWQTPNRGASRPKFDGTDELQSLQMTEVEMKQELRKLGIR